MRNAGAGAAAIAVAAMVLSAISLADCGGRGTGSSGPAPISQAAAPVAPTPDPLPEAVRQIVARYRQTIVLVDGEDTLPADVRERNSLVGKIIFQENHQAVAALSQQLTLALEQAGDFAAPPPAVSHFLDVIETTPDLHDADKLAVREILVDLADTLSGLRVAAPAKAALEGRVADDRRALAEIQRLYEKELDAVFGRFETRGMPVHREAWEQYVAYLHTKYRREDVVKAYADAAARIAAATRPGGPHRDNAVEVWGTGLPAKTFVLTFDDGPHPRYTDRILDILRSNHIKSVFFELGTNLGTVRNNAVTPTRASAASRRLVDAGFTVGSHGFSHALLPKMSDSQVAGEIEETNRLLESIDHTMAPLFRPPYGGVDPKVLAAIDAHRMKSVMWSIDSDDWADPIPASIANRVVGQARRDNHGIILLHDIHEQTIEALPLIIQTLTRDGDRFLAWDGAGFADDAEPQAAAAAPAAPLYHDSWAVIIGIDNYAKWPKLHYAVNDANGVKEILSRKFHFAADHIITLLDADATRERILSVLGDTLANPKAVQHDDRVFVFFAGHGATRRLPSGRDLGYIVPFDADMANFQGQSISMTNFQDISEAIPAKHVLFVMDSCYSGLAVTRGGATDAYIREVTRRSARQMLTAGGADEEVADNGPNGHSVFSWALLQGLEGRADLNGDGFVSATELASYIAPGVSALSHQTPAFGNLPGSQGGDFVFELHPDTEFLSELSTQLDQEAIRLNGELDRIRKEIADKTARNQQLRQQIAAAEAQQKKLTGVAPPPRTESAMQHCNAGYALYAEKRYTEALAEYLAAARIDPSSALAANNAGFVYVKLGQLDEAVRWLEKTIAIDPKRVVAYRNLGDVYYQLNRMADAKRIYVKFLELAPNDSYAPTARARVGGRDARP